MRQVTLQMCIKEDNCGISIKLDKSEKWIQANRDWKWEDHLRSFRVMARALESYEDELTPAEQWE